MQSNSLVKYNTPILVSVSQGASGTAAAKNKKINKAVAGPNEVSQAQHVLNSILPPREWTEDGQLWIQYVSATPATRSDVLNLQEQLNHNLQARQARETGICPVRQELYSQCFDELIRQITINCNERGLLLLRVRDEAQMTITAYETLYESSIAYGVRKALVAEQRKIELDTQYKELINTNRELLQQVESLKETIEATVQRAKEKREAEEKAHAEEVERLTRTNEQLKNSLELMLSAPKK